MKKTILIITILCSINAVFSANCSISWSSTTLSNTTSLATGVSYTLISNTICNGGGGIGASGIPVGNLVTISFPASTDASVVTTGTFNGFPITFITTTATLLTFNAPVNAAKGTVVTIVLNNITNPSLIGTYSTLTLNVTNNSSGTTTFNASNYAITSGPCLQTNLIPNPGFENFSTCPTTANQLSNAISWINPAGTTPDFFNSCAGSICGGTSPFICIPTNWAGVQIPNTGNGYAGIFVGAGDPTREYIQVPLSCPLDAGTEYEFSCYVSLADDYKNAIDELGAYFSTTQVTGTNQLNFTPQVVSPSGFYISDKTGWVLIQGTFFASGGEQFMTFGNFNNELNTSSTIAPGGFLPWSFYYVDDFILRDVNIPLPIELLSFNGKNSGLINELYWSTSTEINNDYFTLERSNDAIHFTGIKEINGAGNSNTLLNYQELDLNPTNGINYYRLKQTDFNGDFSYSKIVALEFNNVEGELSIYPNPSSDFITINYLTNSLKNYNVNVYDAQGRVVINQKISKDKISHKLNINRLNEGIYFIRIYSESKNFKGSFLKQ